MRSTYLEDHPSLENVDEESEDEDSVVEESEDEESDGDMFVVPVIEDDEAVALTKKFLIYFASTHPSEYYNNNIF